VKREDVPIKEVVYGATTNAMLLEAQEKELQLAQQDNKVEQAKEKKNTLESYVYDTRNKVEILISMHQVLLFFILLIQL